MPNMTCPSCRELVRDAEVGSRCVYCGARFDEFAARRGGLPFAIDLVWVARLQRSLIACGGLLLAAHVWGYFGLGNWVAGVPGLAFAGFSIIASAIVVLLLLSALQEDGTTMFLYFVALFIPFVCYAALIGANTRAIVALQRAGLKVGVFGVPTHQARLRLETQLCQHCGYDLRGNTSGRCPECGETFTAERSSTSA